MASNKHTFDFEGAVKYYMETLCEAKDLIRLYRISATTASNVIGSGVTRFHMRKRMELMIESGQVDHDNPEKEIEGIKIEY